MILSIAHRTDLGFCLIWPPINIAIAVCSWGNMATFPLNCVIWQPVPRLYSNGYWKNKACADFLFGSPLTCTRVTPLTAAELLLLY